MRTIAPARFSSVSTLSVSLAVTVMFSETGVPAADGVPAVSV